MQEHQLMFSRSALHFLSTMGLLLAAGVPGAAQVCPNLSYGLTPKLVGSEPWCAVSGDVNRDGSNDLLVGRSPLFNPGSLSLLLNAGSGLFPTSANLAGVFSPRSLALGDMDQDGDLDLVASDQGVLGPNGFDNDGVVVFLNDGLGGFAAQPRYPFDVRDDEPEGLCLGDLDGDGDLDVTVAIRLHQTGPLTSESCVLVYLNDGHGDLKGGRIHPSGAKPGNMVLVDLNGDGALDYSTINGIGSSVSVVFGHGDGSFDSSAASYVFGTYPSGLACGDFDLDGDTDLAVGWKYGLRVLLNQGDGTFTNGPAHAFGYYNKSLAAGDFNQDGKLDLVATFASPGELAILAGDGNANFSLYQSFPAGAQAYAMAIGDWNRDSILDAATADNSSNEIRIWSSHCGTAIYCTAKVN